MSNDYGFFKKNMFPHLKNKYIELNDELNEYIWNTRNNKLANWAKVVDARYGDDPTVYEEFLIVEYPSSKDELHDPNHSRQDIPFYKYWKGDMERTFSQRPDFSEYVKSTAKEKDDFDRDIKNCTRPSCTVSGGKKRKRKTRKRKKTRRRNKKKRKSRRKKTRR